MTNKPPEDRKPREWWIKEGNFDEHSWVGPNKAPGSIHVIEYSALEKDTAEDWKRIQDAERALEAERKRAETYLFRMQEYSTTIAVLEDEYKNVCKFATDYENKVVALEEQLSATEADRDAMDIAAGGYSLQVDELAEKLRFAEKALSFLGKIPTEPYEKQMAKRILELEEGLRGAEALYQELYEMYHKDVNEYSVKCARYEKALQYYADPDNYGSYCGGEYAFGIVENDCGETADRALKGKE